MRLILLALLISLFALTLSAQTGSSDFNDGSTQGWDNGNSAADPTIQAGGPDGANDGYLRISADGSGAGGRVAVFNTSTDWTGNYLDQNIGAISLNAANFSNRDLTIRLVIESGPDRLVTSASLDLAANDNSWQSVFFTLAEEDLVGTADYTTVMSNVTKVWIFHGGTAFPGPNLIADIGVDNINQELNISSVNTFGPDVFSLSPLSQPARSGQAALLVNSTESGNFRADAFDLNGRLILSQTGIVAAQSPQNIQFPALGAGTYVIRFSLEGSFGRSLRTQRLLVR